MLDIPCISEQIAEQVSNASQRYERLILVVGPKRSGKTSAFRTLEVEYGWPLLNLSLLLAQRLLELTYRERRFLIPEMVDTIVSEVTGDVVMLDNIELLFQPDLSQDPLRLLQKMSRHRTLVSAWPGQFRDQTLIYASPQHPEYRSFRQPQAIVLSTHANTFLGTIPLAVQEYIV